MTRFAWIRLPAMVALFAWLSALIMPDPGLLQIHLAEPGIRVAVPRNLEGWRLETGEGDVLVRGRSRLALMELLVERVEVAPGAELAAAIERRHQELRQGKREFAVTFRGEDWRFGDRNLQAYKARYRDRMFGLPVTGVIWEHHVYWPYQGGFLRLVMRYPAIAERYAEPTKYMIAAGLRQSNQEAVK